MSTVQSEHVSLRDPEPDIDLSQVYLLPYLLNRLTSRINQRWLQEIREYGVTVPRWQVLSILAAYDGLRVGRLAEMSGHEQPVVTRLVDQMERDGLVERRRHPEDQRVVQVWITAQAQALLEELAPAATEYIVRMVEPLLEDEQQVLMKLLSRVLTTLDD